MPAPKLCRNPDGRAYATIPGSGRRRVYFGQHGTPEAESAYRRWLGQILRSEEQVAPIPVVTTTTRIADLAAPFLDHAIGYYSRDGQPTEEFRNVRDAMRILLRYARDDLAAAFGPNALRSVRDSMIRDGWTDAKNRKHRYSRAYVNSTVGRILRFFLWCESRELLPRGTSHYLRTLEPVRKQSRADVAERPPVAAVPFAAVKATLPFCRDNLAALIQVQFWSAMRPSEACRICVRDLDISGDIWTYQPERHKTESHGHSLTKAIPEPAQEILRPFIDRSHDPSAPLFLTRFGRPYDAKTYGKAVSKAIKAAGRAGVEIPHWSPLQLRHAIAELVDGLTDRESAQHYLGHSRPDTTAIYAGRNRSAIRRVAQELSAAAAKHDGP